MENQAQWAGKFTSFLHDFLASLLTSLLHIKKNIKKLCVLCKAKKKGTGSTYCGGRSSPGFHPLLRQILSLRRNPRFYSTAFWDPWSSREESRRCRRLQVWREVLWFLRWPSPPLSTLPATASSPSWAVQEPHCGLPPPTNRSLLPSSTELHSNWVFLTPEVSLLEHPPPVRRASALLNPENVRQMD